MDKFNAEQEIEKIRNQIADLIKLLGFTGYADGTNADVVFDCTTENLTNNCVPS